MGAPAAPSARLPHYRIRLAGHRPVAEAGHADDHARPGEVRHRGARRTGHRLRPRARRVVRRRGRAADGALPPGPGSPAGPGLDLPWCLRDPGGPGGVLAFHPATQLPPRTAGDGRGGHVRRPPAQRAGTCPLDAHRAPAGHDGGYVPACSARGLDEPAVAARHTPSHAGRSRRRRPRHSLGESSGHGGAHPRG